MKYCTPEKAGISSADVLKFYKCLDAFNLSTHSVILARGDEIFSECYYEPFNKDFFHRMYSVSKTFVAIAIGFCEQDGLISLDDPMIKYFGEYIQDKPKENIPTSTIRDLLKMKTSIENPINWFRIVCPDRTAVYFDKAAEKYPNTLFNYDSPASYMLGVIVEKVTGKPMLKYLQEKVLDDIGFSKDAYMIQAPGGHSFGDSGVMCTARDLLLFARFVLNKGTFNGKRYLNAEYIESATNMDLSTSDFGFTDPEAYGYGYQIWGAPDGAFAMNGMGTQVALCDPKRDLVFVINSDNQGNHLGYDHVYVALYSNIMNNLSSGESLPENPEAKAELDEYIKSRKLFHLTGNKETSFSRKISGKVFDCDENPMGIKWFKLDLDSEKGTLTYENAQGEKSFPFGMGYNEFAKFPQEGYSDLVATVYAEGNYYDSAFSADWPEEKSLRIRVQVIDKYFGNLAIYFAFKDEDTVSVRMRKKAEGFLREYEGLMNAKSRK